MINKKENITIERIKELLQKEGFFKLVDEEKIGIFGSFARNEDFQDIDLLIEKPKDILELYYIKEKLKKKYKIRFDFMIKEYADPIILRNSLKDIIYV